MMTSFFSCFLGLALLLSIQSGIEAAENDTSSTNLSGNGTTCERRQLGQQECFTDRDCKADIANSICFRCLGNASNDCNQNNTCQCEPGFINKKNGTTCERLVLGDLCEESSQCTAVIPGTDCLNGQCLCQKGYEATKCGQCIKPSVGMMCSNDSDCKVIPNAECNDWYRLCFCHLGFKPSVNLTSCERLQLGDPCVTQMDCNSSIAHGVCQNQNGSKTCACEMGYKKTGNWTCQMRDNGDHCMTDDDCTAAITGSQCQEAECACLPGAFFISGEHICKKRTLTDQCNNDTDCSDAIDKTKCKNNICVCEDGFERYDHTNISTFITNTSTNVKDSSEVQCVRKPQNLTDTCRTDVQCKRIHPVSVCRAPLDCSSDNCQPVCNCSTGTFINIQRNECVNLPTKLNDQCLEHHHCDSIGSSLCLSVNKSVTECKCRYGHFSNSNQTACHMYPRQFGDYCEENIHCEQHLTSNYTCDTDNHTCVCSESHKLVGIECVQRDPIPLHKMVPFQGVVPCDHTCVNWTNSQCGTKKDINGTFCQCLPRYARRYNSSQCVPVQTYVVQLELVQEASQYSYKTMNYTSEYAFQQRPPFQILANRITINGLQELFNQSRFGYRYVSSDVMDVGPIGTHNGVKVKVLLHLTAHYMNATTEADILEEIQSVLYRKGPSNSSEPYVELGESRLRLDRKVLGSAQGINIQDYDECASRLTHDCHINATCLNTLGSYLCVCRPQFEDMSRVAGLELGRKCETRRVISLHDEACSSEDCSTTWEFVALALALFLIVLLAFIVYEIIQKKQTFTARKLYEKFGTTKIRRLRKASIARIHEVKRRQQEMRKKNKSKKQKKKDDLLTISEVDENVDVGAAVPPTRKPSSKKRKKKDKKKKDTIFSDTAISGPEEAAPSSVEATAPSVNIVHPPAMPSTDSLGMDA